MCWGAHPEARLGKVNAPGEAGHEQLLCVVMTLSALAQARNSATFLPGLGWPDLRARGVARQLGGTPVSIETEESRKEERRADVKRLVLAPQEPLGGLKPQGTEPPGERAWVSCGC